MNACEAINLLFLGKTVKRLAVFHSFSGTRYFKLVDVLGTKNLACWWEGRKDSIEIYDGFTPITINAFYELEEDENTSTAS